MGTNTEAESQEEPQGPYVFIHWVECGRPESAAGHLIGCYEENGEWWASLDWGYSISFSADQFQITTTEPQIEYDQQENHD